MTTLCKSCMHEGTDERFWCKGTGEHRCTVYEVHATKEDVVALRKEIADLKSKTRCAYCGKEFPLDTVTADQVEKHIFGCDKHPVWYLGRASNAMAREIRRHRKSTSSNQEIIQEFIDSVQVVQDSLGGDEV